MIDHIWTVVCSRAVINKDNNNVNLQNVVEQLTIEGKPETGAVVPLRLDVVSLWARADPHVPCQGRMRVAFLSPSGKNHGTAKMDVNLTETERHRTTLRLHGMPAEESGRHVFAVELRADDGDEWQKVAGVPLTIAFKPPQEE